MSKWAKHYRDSACVGCNPTEVANAARAHIADIEAALDEATDAWASYLNMCPSIRGRKRLDEIRALIGK